MNNNPNNLGAYVSVLLPGWWNVLLVSHLALRVEVFYTAQSVILLKIDTIYHRCLSVNIVCCLNANFPHFFRCVLGTVTKTTKKKNRVNLGNKHF